VQNDSAAPVYTCRSRRFTTATWMDEGRTAIKPHPALVHMENSYRDGNWQRRMTARPSSGPRRHAWGAAPACLGWPPRSPSGSLGGSEWPGLGRRGHAVTRRRAKGSATEWRKVLKGH
jgi:hypothetical protein